MTYDPIPFPGSTSLDVPVERVCEEAGKACSEVPVIGETPDGEFYLASSSNDRCWPALMLLRAMREYARLDEERA